MSGIPLRIREMEIEGKCYYRQVLGATHLQDRERKEKSGDPSRLKVFP